MAQYVYPAVFTEEDCGYSINFPDLENCFTSAETLGEGIKMANDRKFFDNRAVKKTLSIPSWLNDMAERADVNFSATLQAALKQQLHIQ